MSLKNKKLGLALSGGGTRGAFHCGFLEGFKDFRPQVAAVSGTSIGSVIGAFYCAGYTPVDILNIFQEQSMLSLLRINLGKHSLMALTGLKKIMNSKLPVDFNDLEIPLSVAVTDLDNDDPVILNQGNLQEVIIASCSIPILFKPTTINGVEYVDGGLVNNLPVESLLGKVDRTIGVHINKYYFTDDQKDKNRTADKAFSLVIRQNVIHSKKHCNYFIEPNLEYVSVLDLNKMNDFFEIGKSFGQRFTQKPNDFENKKHSILDTIKLSLNQNLLITKYSK